MTADRLIQAEQRLIESLGSTTSNFAKVSRCIEFPFPITRQTIIDLGAGASSVPVELAKRGANVFAIDYRYSQPEALQQTSKGFIDEIDRAIKSPLMVLSGKSADLARQKQDFIDSRERFFQDFESPHPKANYLAASFRKIPFPDNTFTFAYSIGTLTDYSLEPELLLIMVEEGLRVLGNRKELHVSPWQQDYFKASGRGAENTLDNALKFLKSQGIHAVRREHRQSKKPFLAIIKI